MDNKQTMDENTENLVKKLNKLRDARNDRIGYCDEILKLLNYKKKRKPYEFNAFLVKAVNIRFNESQDADIVLMAFGLLQGYKQTTVTERRYEYLKESDYFPDDLRSKIKPYNEATKEEKDALTGNLRKGRENTCIKWLADFLLDQSSIGKFIEEIDDYIDTVDGKKIAKLPEPSYLKNKRVVQNEYADSNNVGNELDKNNNFQTTTKQESENNLDEKINIAQEESTSEEPAPESIKTENQHDRENGSTANAGSSSSAEIGNQISIHISNIMSGQEKTDDVDVIETPPKPKEHMPKRWKWQLIITGVAGSIVTGCFIWVIQFLFPLNANKKIVEEIHVFNNEFDLPVGEKETLAIVTNPPDADMGSIHCVVDKNPELVTIENAYDVRAQSQAEWRDEAEHTATVLVQGGHAEKFTVEVTVINPWIYEDRAKDNLPNSEY